MKKKYAVASAAAMIFSSTVLVAGHADSGSSGTSSSNSSVNPDFVNSGLNYGDGYKWKSWSGNPNSTQNSPWARFLKEAGNGNGYTMQYTATIVDGMVQGGGIHACMNSSNIWALVNDHVNDRWVWSYNGYTHGANMDSSKISTTLENPEIASGTQKPSSQVINNFKQWDIHQNGRLLDNSPGYTLVCDGAFQSPAPRVWASSTVSDVLDDSVVDETNRYSCQQVVDPQVSRKGKNDLHSQSGPVVVTNFGKIYDELESKVKNPKTVWTQKDVDQYKARILTAENLDKSLHCSVVLDSSNKKGLNEGGVLNFHEQSAMATIHLQASNKSLQADNCTWTQSWVAEQNAWGEPSKKCSIVQNYGPMKSSYVTTLNTLSNSSFYQQISIMDSSKFSTFIADAVDAKTLSQGDGSTTASVAQTQTYPTQPKILEFGNSSNPDQKLAATADPDYYN